MLLSLCHNTVSSSNNEDSAVHLSSAGDHVLYVVSMSGAVNVSIVTLFCLILNVCCGDSDSTLSLLGRLVDLIECGNNVSCYLLRKNLCDRSGKSCLAVINVTDRTDVTMRFCSVEMLFCHYVFLLNNLRIIGSFLKKAAEVDYIK